MKDSTPLSPFERKILEVFAAAYPSSAQARGGKKLRKGSWEKLLPEIAASVEGKEGFLAGVEMLARKGAISVRWKRYLRNDTVEALYLEDAGMLFSLLGIASPEALREEQLGFLGEYVPPTPEAHAIKDHCLARITSGGELPCRDTATLRDILNLLTGSHEKNEASNLRALSVRLYRNSKRLEEILPMAERLFREACGIHLSERFGLTRSYPETTFAGRCALAMTDGRTWRCAGEALVLPLETLRTIRSIAWDDSAPCLLSIENKESFYTLRRAREDFSGFLYTSGHLNEADRLMIRLIHESGAAFFHAGDLDPDGLLIFEEINAVCEGTCSPFFMDLETYRTYSAYGYTLPEGSLKRLEAVKSEFFISLIEEMRHTKMGVEQEVISYQQ